MLPFHPAFFLMYKIMGQPAEDGSANNASTHHLGQKPALTPDPLYLRLVPRVIRTLLKAHLEARAYEKTLVRIWETSPHLMDDIGIVVDPGNDLPDHLIAAPQRVIDRMAAIERARATPAGQITPPPVKPKPQAPKDRQPLSAAIHAAPFGKRARWSIEGSL